MYIGNSSDFSKKIHSSYDHIHYRSSTCLSLLSHRFCKKMNYPDSISISSYLIQKQCQRLQIKIVIQFKKYLKIDMSQLDQDCITYTQEGRILQIEYATKAVESAETIVGVKCADGVIMGAQKLMFSKLLVNGTHRRIFNVDKHIGMAICGKIPDGRHIMSYGRNECQKYIKDYDVDINGRTLANRISLYLNAYTLYNSVRPFGSCEIISSYNSDDGYQLFMLEPSGVNYGYKCCTAGKGRQTAKAQFQKTDFSKLTCREALFHVCKILLKTHEQSREKKYEYEISWICEQSKNTHRVVPQALIDEALKKAEEAIEEQEMG